MIRALALCLALALGGCGAVKDLAAFGLACAAQPRNCN